MDRKADKARDHGEQLRRDREVILERIAGYHRYIDQCTREMSKNMCEYLIAVFKKYVYFRGL